MNTDAIGYIRVSTNDQSNSIIVQTERIINYCKFQGLNLVEIITDEDISGFTEFNKRPGGKKANNILGGNVKTIVSIKPDRLFRNVQDALLTTDKWNEKDIELHIIDMGGASFTTKTAIGRLIFTVVIANAQFERDNTGERTKAILNNKKSSGKAYSRAILGFDKINGHLVPNKEEQETLAVIFNLTSQQWAPNKISKYLNSNNFKTKEGGPFYPSTIQYILKNPIYKQSA